MRAYGPICSLRDSDTNHVWLAVHRLGQWWHLCIAAKLIDLPIWDPFLTYDINALALTSYSLIVFEAHSVFKRLRAIICDHMGPAHTFFEKENTRVHTKQVDKIYI